jgi:hypothetical protein
MGSSEDRTEAQEARRWQALVRELGIVGIAVAAGVSIVAIVVQARAPQPVIAVAAPSAPPTPTLAASPLPPTPAAPGGVTIYNSGSTDAYSVTIGNAGGVTSITTHHLGDEYQNYTEFLGLLKQRDPELYAWTVEKRKQSAQSQYTTPLKQRPGSKVVGETGYGQEIVEGQTLVVPLKKRTAEEIEANYKRSYEFTRGAYLEELRQKEQLERLKSRRAAKTAVKPAGK